MNRCFVHRSILMFAMTLATTLATTVALSGCDKPKAGSSQSTGVAGNSATLPVIAPLAAHPTTESLLHGTQASVPLQIVPITISAPTGWAIANRSGIEYFEGPTPAGVAQIQIAHRTFPTSGFGKAMIAASKKNIDVPEKNALDHVLTHDLSDGVSVIDIRHVGRKINGPAIDNSGKQIAATYTPVDWKINVSLPSSGNQTEFAEIAFVDLSVEQYELDKELLEQMIASIHFDPSALGMQKAPSKTGDAPAAH